ncbi:MAG: DegV family EDD domain-containing protein [Lachnospiraceae bacterium]|nr:DegV family EDD domain-containing protein [Lachnospiraceae bacterium]
MGIKNFFQPIEDRNLSLQERLFRLVVLLGIGGLLAGVITGLVTGGNMGSILLLVAVVVFFCIVYFCSIHFQKIQQGAVVIAIVLIFLVMPTIFLNVGGSSGGGALWLLFGMVYVCLVVEGKMKYILLISSCIVNAFCYYIVYNHMAQVDQLTTEVTYINSIVSLLVVAALVCCMILFQNAMYRSENAIAREKKRKIDELNRAQSRFFSSMSHEIRTPINTIIGLNEMILREDVSEEVATDAINIQGASKMLLSLINDFLDMSKIESGKMDIVPVEYDVGAMLSELVNMIWVRAKEKGLEFHVDVDGGVPARLIGDEVRIKQVLVNVLNNSIKYTESGSVTLSIQSKGNEDGEEQISYSVTDTGIGIKKESIPHLFSAFKRVDQQKNRHIEGTGLGLSIVKQLVDLMGGDIAVNSVYTKGSTFVITLPQKVVGEDKIGEINLEAKRNIGARTRYKQSFEAPEANVLLVDDNETNLMVAEKLLRDTKVQVDSVTSGEKCLNQTLNKRYDVILMDHLMPGMDGIECLHQIRSQLGGLNKNTRVVILTANAGKENQALYRKEGFDGYLPKPITGAQLERELLKHLPKEIVSRHMVDGTVGIVETPVLTHNKKLPVLISTESLCDMPEEILEEHQVAVMPYRVVTDKGEFLDGIEVEAEGVLSYIREKGRFAQSKQPLVSDYEEFFANQLTKAQYIIHIAVSQNISRGYANALEAAKAFDNVIVVDSGHVSSVLGLMALQAARYAEEDMSVDEIIQEIEVMKKRFKTSFVIRSTEYLNLSGRLSSIVNALCKALMLHPVLVLRNGAMKVGTVHMGAEEHVRKKYINSMLSVKSDINTEILFIAHAGLTKEELEDIEEQVRQKVKFDKVIRQKVSPAISTNCGPGSLGLFFMTK